MKITFLGTSAAVPTIKRNVSAVALQFDQKREWWLFDCGEGTQRQISKANLSLFSLEKIFISHMHADHILGLGGLLATRGLIGATTKITVYGPTGIEKFITDTMYSAKMGSPNKLLEIIEIPSNADFDYHKGLTLIDSLSSTGTASNIINEYSISAFKVPHGPFTMAFVVTEVDRQGTFHADKAKELGIPPGPIYRRLKEGEIVKLEDGREIDGKTLIDPPRKGRKLVVVCDTSCAVSVLSAGKDCDVMIHEATYAEVDAGLAKENGHSTALQAGKTAVVIGAKTLLMSHFSPRYDQRAEDGVCIEDLVKEAKSKFNGTVIAAWDMMQYEIKPR